MSDELRVEPRISVNKLAEYVVTQSPRRRRTIITDQIKPSPYVTSRYEDARRVLAQHLSEPSRERKQLLRMGAVLRDRAAELSADDDRRKSLLASARAVEAFADIADRLKVKNAIATTGARRNADLVVAGVRVVVCPDVAFLERGTERRVGGAKFHFPVANRLTTEALRYAAAMLYAHHEHRGDSPRRDACIAVDVMAGEFESAPRAMKERMKNVEAACQEIAERWPLLYESLRRQSASE